MNTFRVWAPNASKIEVETGGRRYEMKETSRGWREAVVSTAKAGDDYWFVIDDGEPIPDPRSPSQPAGIAGPSRLVDHSSFRWAHDDWRAKNLQEAVIYELHVGTFSPEGTFDGAISGLAHLVELGVNAIELLPVAEASGSRGWGYDGADLWAPHHVYGGPDGLKRLVDACHARGVAVMLDVVYNHLGPAGNYLSEFGPYFTHRYTTPWGIAINLDGAGSDEVRGYFCDHAAMLLRDYRFDGLRLDAVHEIFDRSATHFLEQLAETVRDLERELRRPLVVIAESDLNNPRVIQDKESGGYGIDAQWNDDFHHSLHTVLTGDRSGYLKDFGTIEDLAKAIRQAWVFDGKYSPFRDRRFGRKPSGLSAHKFIGYLQNHDQAGNRAKGERSSHLMDCDRLKIGAALVLTAPFVPMLFQGEEWGAMAPFLYFTDHSDPELGMKVREGRRSDFVAFGWKSEEVPDPQDRATFLSSRLDWNEISQAPHRELLEWHRALIKLRQEVPALRDDRLDRTRVRFDEAARWIAIDRGPVSVLCNFADEERVIPSRSGAVALSSMKIREPASSARSSSDGFRLPPVSVVILKS
jgi:maltooligosyltrehalose trehalohydrolase